MKTLIDAGVFKGTKDFLNHFKKYGGNYNRAESLQNLQTYKLKERCQVTLQRKEINNGENSKH
tara:strand:- start:23 stop:211 length:189 start_codon:yes stop_codon:yes gene_type:complete